MASPAIGFAEIIAHSPLLMTYRKSWAQNRLPAPVTSRCVGLHQSHIHVSYLSVRIVWEWCMSRGRHSRVHEEFADVHCPGQHASMVIEDGALHVPALDVALNLGIQ